MLVLSTHALWRHLLLGGIGDIGGIITNKPHYQNSFSAMFTFDVFLFGVFFTEAKMCPNKTVFFFDTNCFCCSVNSVFESTS